MCNPPIGSIYHLYTTYLLYCHLGDYISPSYHLPPIKGTRNNHRQGAPIWTSRVDYPWLIVIKPHDRWPTVDWRNPKQPPGMYKTLEKQGNTTKPQLVVAGFLKTWYYVCRHVAQAQFLGIGLYPIGSMYGIFTFIYHENQLNVGKYTIYGSSGYGPKKPTYRT